jgi:RNA polymerase sigma factor (sigma-70 family)
VEQPEPISNQELVDKYGRLAGFLAWRFVRQNHKALPFKDQDHPLLGTEDAEDLASAALVKLVRCPMEHRHEPGYVKTLITNAIINAWHKRLKTLRAERQAREVWESGEFGPHGGDRQAPGEVTTLLERVPDSTDMELNIQSQMDSTLAAGRVTNLPAPERIVIELSFGLNGCKPVGLDRIAKKLGRSRWWAEVRLKKGIERLREDLQIKPANTSFQEVL